MSRNERRASFCIRALGMAMALFALAALIPCSAQAVLTYQKTAYEAVDLAVDFAQVLGADTMALASVTAINAQNSADVTATVIAASPAPAIIPAVIGTVDTSGNAVIWVGGTQFNTAWPAGWQLQIGNQFYRVATVNSATSITLQSSAGQQSGAAYSSANKVSFRVHQGVSGVTYRVSVKVIDSTNGQQWEGLVLLPVT